MMRKASWVATANSTTTDFPLNNLPYGVFSPAGGPWRCGVAIGDFVLDVAAVDHRHDPALFSGSSWNAVMAAGPETWRSLRDRLTKLLSEDLEKAAVEPHLHPLADVKLGMPFAVSEYTDFYAGKHHATNVGTLFRGADKALPENWLSIPIGYNGRASSVRLSGDQVVRPWGQLKRPDDALPHFAPSRKFDFELELGAIVGQASTGMISVDEADAAIFGFVLLNDWSARDIQAWEYQPLGPFQAKASATTISPWIVSRLALEPFRTAMPAPERPLLPYLSSEKPTLFSIALEVDITSASGESATVCRTDYAEMYYSAAQQICHHTSSGCPMRVGDLIGSGTISGKEVDSFGSMLELSWNGSRPVSVGGEERTFIEDGDTVTMRGAAIGSDYRIGFGLCEAQLAPCVPQPSWAR